MEIVNLQPFKGGIFLLYLIKEGNSTDIFYIL